MKSIVFACVVLLGSAGGAAEIDYLYPEDATTWHGNWWMSAKGVAVTDDPNAYMEWELADDPWYGQRGYNYWFQPNYKRTPELCYVLFHLVTSYTPKPGEGHTYSEAWTYIDQRRGVRFRHRSAGNLWKQTIAHPTQLVYVKFDPWFWYGASKPNLYRIAITKKPRP